MSLLAATVTAASSLTLLGASSAAAAEPLSPQAGPSPQAGLCGSGVYLDGLRALDTEPGHDEVYITRAGTKIWPATADYVSIAAGQRVEIDKCVARPAQIQIWDVDGVFPFETRQLICGFTIHGESTFDQKCSSGVGSYRVGVLR
ncbi:hypothetical protein [Kribbella amoyensis]|nr:hypothetical protein [Kribbella amoyensis]